MAGKSRHQEPEDVATLNEPTVRKQGSGCMYLARFLLFIQPQPQIQRMVLFTIKMGLPASVHLIKIILYRLAHRPIS